MKEFIKLGIGKILKKFYFKENSSLAVFIFHEVTDNPSLYQKRDNLFHTKKEFVKIIEWISKNYTIISPSDLGKKNYVKSAIITFDDGFLGSFNFAIKYLISKKIPSISFLNLRPILKRAPNVVSLVQYLRDNNQYFIKFMKKNNLGYNVDLKITPILLKNFLENNKKIDLNKAIEYQGKIIDINVLNKFKDKKYVFFGNHLYDHWNCNIISNQDFRHNYEKNYFLLKKFKNTLNFFSFPHGFLRNNFLENISHSYHPKKTFIFTQGLNKLANSDTLNRVSLRSYSELRGVFYYNIFRGKFNSVNW